MLTRLNAERPCNYDILDNGHLSPDRKVCYIVSVWYIRPLSGHPFAGLFWSPTNLATSSLKPTVTKELQRYVSTEGQGLYIFGGVNDLKDPAQRTITQAFMIDLSVSWNTSDPVFKKLPDGPGAMYSPCTVLSDGDIFLLHFGIEYIYKVKSDSWTLLGNNKFPLLVGYAATDPESGRVYSGIGIDDNTNEATLHVLDPRANAFSTLKVPELANTTVSMELAWSAHLRSMIFMTWDPNIMYVFTPSKVSESSHGWSLMNTTGFRSQEVMLSSTCLVPAYGGSKVVAFSVLDMKNSMVQILDIPPRKWIMGLTTTLQDGSACAVSGDHFIAWGGGFNDTFRDSTIVYNMKTNKWVSRYTAPPRVSTTTLPASPTSTQYDPRTTTASDLVDTPTSDEKLATIIGVVIGVLLTIILTAIFIYLRSTNRSKAEAQPTSSNGSSSDSLGSVIDGNSKGASSSRPKGQKFTLSGVLGLPGARPASEHPHAIVEDSTAKRNAQEGAIEVLPISQHPHTTMEQDPIAKYHDKAELESNQGHKEPTAQQLMKGVRRVPAILLHVKLVSTIFQKVNSARPYNYENLRDPGWAAMCLQTGKSAIPPPPGFQPIPVAYPAYASIEGQGFYIIGGAKEAVTGTSITQAFMIDLSVSWNASDPVFKKLPEGPGPAFAPTTVLSDGDIFTLHIGVGYIYKVKSNSWTLFGNSKFPFQTGYAATNPESGLVYIAFGTNSTLHVLDPNAKTLSTLKVPRLTNVADTQELVWSAHLRSVILSTADPNIMYVFTPSKASESSQGWSLMNTTGFQPTKTFLLQACFVPAYGGSKVITITVLDGSNSTTSMAQILDIPTRKWTASPTMALRAGSACGVSGDYFIVWGGGRVTDLERFTDGIVVYNMKTNEFVSEYTAPSVSPTPTQYNPHTTAVPDLEDTSTSDKKRVIIIAIAAGVLLTIILTAIFIYLRITRRLKAGVQSTSSNGPSSDLRPASEHPHAIVEDPTAKRNAQEGAIEVLPIPQHPHAVVERDPITKYNDKAELESSGGWGDKAELEDE
ncbi:MAG: hypothetical protein J3Q66DRAFT_402054 [Benniella sp.]|nr:MAG: hypothetical protein J3Q66DRAFT_402054 [Benniella sp.]